ncbi:MAG: DUF2339 domain-containing protein [Acidobacteria bacterium]|nr:DUF2339 domain-containing protein [Acidobacteriota bacterium]
MKSVKCGKAGHAMADDLSAVETRLESVVARLEILETRIAALEGRNGRPLEPAPVDAGAPAPPTSKPTDPNSHGAGLVPGMTLVGRTFIVLGGAYLLRAFTDSGVLPHAAGIAIGLAYALCWMAFAARAARERRRPSATFHVATAALIAYPLVFEATVRFAAVSPATGAWLLSIVTAVLLAPAPRWHLRAATWLTTVGGMATAIVLINRTGRLVPFAMYLVALGVAALWVGYVRHWRALRWPVAIAADLSVLAVGVRVGTPGSVEVVSIVFAAQILLLAGYLGSVAARTLLLGRDVIPFEIAQSMAALAIGLGGAVHVAQTIGSGLAGLGAVCLLFGLACYGVAFAFLDRHLKLKKNFYFYTSLAVVFMLTGSALLLDRAVLGIVSGLLAVASAWLGHRFDRVSLNLHAAVYGAAAILVSGLFGCATYGVLAPPTETWRRASAGDWVVLGLVASALSIPLSTRAESWGRYSRAPRTALLALFAWTSAGVIACELVPMFAGTPGANADEGVVATVRTTVIVLGAIGLAVVARFERFTEAGWLVYPVLIGSGIKLLLEDFPRSRPTTLFLALALYGAGLIVGPRLMRRRAPTRV